MRAKDRLLYTSTQLPRYVLTQTWCTYAFISLYVLVFLGTPDKATYSSTTTIILPFVDIFTAS